MPVTTTTAVDDPTVNWWDLPTDQRNQYLYGQYGFDPNGNNEEGAMFQQYAQALYPETAQEIQWLNAYLGPQYRDQIQNFVQQMNDPGNLAAQSAQNANQSYEQAGNAGNLLAAQLKGQGYGSGAQTAAVGSAYQGAQQNVNAFNTQQMSPQARLARLSASLQALQGGFQMPGLQAQESLFAPIEQRHEANQSEQGSGSVWNTIAPVIGAAAGSIPWGHLGGSSGGGGTGNYSGVDPGGSYGGYA